MFQWCPYPEHLLKDWVEGVLLHFGLPLATLGLVWQQVHLHVSAETTIRHVFYYPGT